MVGHVGGKETQERLEDSPGARCIVPLQEKPKRPDERRGAWLEPDGHSARGPHGKTAYQVLEARVRQVELDAELAFEDRAREANFGAGTKHSNAVTGPRCGVGIGDAGNGIEIESRLDDGVEAGSRQEFVARRLPRIGDIAIGGRAVESFADGRAGGIWCVEASDVGRSLKGLEAFNCGRGERMDATNSKIIVLERSGRHENSARIGFLIFGEK